jgi:RimJ/RimL family protein N-acetyltransferase
VIETDRLLIREWREADRTPFAAINTNTEVMQHLGGVLDQTQSDQSVDRQIASQKDHGYCFWAIERKIDDALLGYCGLRRGGHAGTDVHDEIEIGWRLARSAWGHGNAREAAEACLAWGWSNTGASRIAAWTVSANSASWGLMIRLGFTHRPNLDFEHPSFEKGHPLCHHIVYIIERPND